MTPKTARRDKPAETRPSYGETCSLESSQRYLHEEEEAAPYQQKAGTFTPWEDISSDTDMLFYEALHGAIVTETVNVAQYADLLIGVVPVINLEWVQKLHRDEMVRGYTQEAVITATAVSAAPQ